MKLISLILAIVLVCGLFGCSPKETDPLNGEKETNINETEKENDKDDLSDTDFSVGGETDDDNKEDGGADSSDSVPSDKENTGTVTDAPEKENDSDDSEKDGKDTEASADDGNNGGSDNGTFVYNDGVLIEAYAGILAGYFYSDYKRQDGPPDADLIHLTVLFLYSQRSKTLMFSDDKSRFSVSGDTMEKTMQLLFGNEVSLSDYITYLDADMSDTYDEAGNIFSFDAKRPSWGEGGYTLSFDHPMDFSETDKAFELEATLINKKGKERTVKYKFSKVVFEEYLYFRLEEVDKK